MRARISEHSTFQSDRVKIECLSLESITYANQNQLFEVLNLHWVIGSHLIYIVIQPVGIQRIRMASPRLHRSEFWFIVFVVAIWKWNIVHSFSKITFVFAIKGQHIIFWMSCDKDLTSFFCYDDEWTCFFGVCKNCKFFLRPLLQSVNVWSEVH